MSSKFSQISCLEHPNQTITHFCNESNCDQKLLCNLCLEDHTPVHDDHIRDTNYFFKYEVANTIERIKSARVKHTWFFQHRITETEEAFEQMRVRLEEAITQTRDTIIKDLHDCHRHQERNLAGLQREFERLSREFNLNSSKDEDSGNLRYHSTLTRTELANFIALNQELKNHKSLIDVSSYQSGYNMKDVEDLVNNVKQFISSYSKLTMNDQPIINFPVTNDYLNIENLKPEKYVENQAPVLWHSVELLADKNILVVGDLKGALTLWSESEGFKKLFKIRAHKDWISNVKYSPAKNLVISGSLDQTINVYKVLPGPSLKLLRTLRHKPANWVRGLLVLDEKNVLLSSGNLPNINVWDLNTFKLKGIIDTKGKGSTGAEMTYVSTFNLVAVGFLQGVIGLYDLETNCEVALINTGHSGCRINSMQFLKRENLLVAGVAPGKIKCWKIGKTGGEFIKEYEVPGRQPSLLLPVKNEESLLVASFTEEIYSLNLTTGKLLQLPQTGLNECVTLRVIPRKKKLIIGDFGSRKIAVMTYE